MPETLEAPPAPTQDISRTPTLLESLAASGADIASSPRITAKQLPPIGTEPETKKKPEEKKAEVPQPAKEESAPELKKEELTAKATPEQLQKDAETISEKLFSNRKRSTKPADTSREDAGAGDGKAGTVGDNTAPKPDAVKPAEGKTKEQTPKPAARRPAPTTFDEAEITERAAAAAARAVSDSLSKAGQKQPDKLEKGPEASLTPEERKQFVVYKELEALDPARYQGVSDRFIKSLSEISEYVKAWSKDNPGTKFNEKDKEHDAFFERVEPEVDQDDWDDAKISIKSREISARAIAPINERMQQMERERARTALEPVLQSKQLEATHMLLEHFDPEVAELIRKPDGLKELAGKDPITVSVLTAVSGVVGNLASEVVRLHDPMGGVVYSAENPAHKEIAEFIVGQEKRIASLPAGDRERDGKQFMPRQQYQHLTADQKSRYWFLNQDDVINLLTQKYALQAKKIRDSEVEKFNKTAESLGFKKIDVPKEAPNSSEAKVKEAKETPRTKETSPSPEATSRASTKPTPGGTGAQAPSPESAIVGALFSRYKSA